MDCKEFEMMIPDFIERRLDFRALERFGRHMEQCADCREELTIQFLITEGIQRLEEGSAFDLQAELNQRVEEAGKKVRFHNGALLAGTILELLALSILAGFIIWILL